jgi:uncharacterized membrane protein YvbJ
MFQLEAIMAACPECGGKMSGMAEACPHCGFMMKHKQVLKQKQKEKRHKKGRNHLLIGILCLGFGLIMSMSGVNVLLCLVPLVLGVGLIGYGFLLLIGLSQ